MNSKRCRKLMKELELMHTNYDELYDHMIELSEDLKRAYLENEYKSAFISYYQLDNEYAYFRNKAHRIKASINGEELPFDTFTID